MRLMKQVTAQADNFELLRGVMLISRKAVRTYGVSPAWAFRRALRLVRQYRFKPQEGFDWGLMDPAVEDRALAGFVSKAAMSRMQNRLNPRDWYYITEDKSIFYRICQQQDIPAPKLYGITYREHPGWLADNRIALQPSDWESTLRSVSGNGLVVKPSRSLFGRGVEVYSKEGDEFQTPEGSRLSLTDLGRRLCSEANYTSLIVQERLRNHKAFAAVGRSDYLQTLRVITLVDQQGQPRILACFLKLIRGDNATDNWDGGRSGNLILRLDPTTGAPLEALHGNQDTQTVQRSTWLSFCEANHDLHPEFVVPDWAEVMSLCSRLAMTFVPLRTVGWDLAVTDDGVSVLEGNYRAGPYPTVELAQMMKPAFELMHEFQKA